MLSYLEYFREEAKQLLKSLKNNNQEAKERCLKVFGLRENITLMNAQHVIAKEYGFESWNDLISKEPHKLAEALNATKNKKLETPLKSWSDDIVTINPKEIKIRPPKIEYDSVNKTFMPRPGMEDYMIFGDADISSYDLSGINPLKVSYTEDTKWPASPSMLPKGFNPKEFLESRKNPGLGIKTLHKQGIKGKGRAIAVIDSFRARNHIEYHNNIKGYEEIGDCTIINVDSAGFISSFVGKTCGIAPFADMYYYAVNSENKNQTNYAIAIQKVCELHKKLISEGKNGIDVIHIQRAITLEIFKNDEGYEKTIQVTKEAEDLGIWCNISNRFEQNKLFREERIFCKLDGDVNNPNDYELTEYSVLHKVPRSKQELFTNSLCFPGGARTVASSEKMDAYKFTYCAGPFSKTFASGLYLLAKSVKESITPYEFFEQGLKTGDFKEGVGIIINPIRLIESLK